MKQNKQRFLASFSLSAMGELRELRELHRNVVCHHTSNNPTAPQRRSRCDVGQTSKAKASNSFSVTLGDPAALRFLHMYTENPMFLKTHECILMRKRFLMHWSGATVHFLNYLLLSRSLRSRDEFASTVSLPSPRTQCYSWESVTVVLTFKLWVIRSHRHHPDPGQPPTNVAFVEMYTGELRY